MSNKSARNTAISVIKDIISRILNISYNDIEDDDDIVEKLGATNTDFMWIMQEIEKAFNFEIRLPQLEIIEPKTIDNLLEIISEDISANEVFTQLRFKKVIAKVFNIPTNKIPECEELENLPDGNDDEKQKQIIVELSKEFERYIIKDILEIDHLNDLRNYSVNEIVDLIYDEDDEEDDAEETIRKTKLKEIKHKILGILAEVFGISISKIRYSTDINDLPNARDEEIQEKIVNEIGNVFNIPIHDMLALSDLYDFRSHTVNEIADFLCYK